MNIKGRISIKESKAKITEPTLMRLAGLSAILAGLCFLIIGTFHPLNVPAAVTTAAWVNVHIAASALGFFGLFGMAGLYARQVRESGWLGLAGFLLFTAWLTLVCGFSFVEAFILPRLATESPAFIEAWMAIFTGAPSAIDLGVLPTLWNISGPLYIIGLLLFGIATFRAGVLPRWAAVLLALNIVWAPLGALVPPEYQPKIMLPVGLALAWLGSALLVERREKSPEPMPDQKAVKSQPGQVA